MFRFGITWSLFHIGHSGIDAVDALARLGSTGINYIELV